MSTFAVVTIAAVLAAGYHQQNSTSTPAAAVPATPAPQTAATPQMDRARLAESDGRFADAVKSYREAAASGSGLAARRLGDLYLRGAPGVERDHAQALRWYRQAELRGEVLAQAVRLR